MTVSRKPRRVLLIGNNIGSMLQFRTPIIRRLVADGWEVHLLVPTESVGLVTEYRQQVDALAGLGAAVHEYALRRAGSNPLEDLRSAWAMLHHVRAIRPDVVLSYMIKPVIYGSLAAWGAGVPRRYAMLDGLGVSFSPPADGARTRATARIARRLLGVALRRVHHLVLLNSDDPVTLRDEGVLPPDLPFTVVAGTGIDLDHYDFTPANPASRTFVMIARLLREKGVREFAQAAAIVKARRPDARFILIGEVDPAPGAISREEVAGWSAVDYLGAQRDVRPMLRDCLAFVLPSYYGEGRPRTVMEAMSMGRASIVADNRGSRDCVADGVNGRLVPPRDPQALAAAMEQYLDRPEDALAHGLKARRLAEDVYAEAKVVDATLSALELRNQAHMAG